MTRPEQPFSLAAGDSAGQVISFTEDIAGAQAALAAKRALISERRILADTGDACEEIRYAITLEGAVLVRTPGWDAVVEDGQIRGFRRW